MRVSIIIPAYNADKHLAECLQACKNQTHPDTEIILVDDGSTDSTPHIAQSAGVHYVHQPNRGPAAARNHGARLATGEILAFTDSDCIPQPNWIEALLAEFREGVVAVGRTYGIANPDSRLARIVHEEIAIRHERFSEQVDFLGSFNFACRKVAFDSVGGFDEDFTYASGEDNDLSYRLTDQGGRLRFTRAAVVNHYHPEKLKHYLRTQMLHGFWRMKLYAKHPRRARGDHYAGMSDLAGPPLALMCISLVALSLGLVATGNYGVLGPIGGRFYNLALGTITLLYVLPNSERYKELGKRIHVKLTRFGYIFLLRDLARALGLVRGVWHFLILRRKTA